jgi:hypothetical protein
MVFRYDAKQLTSPLTSLLGSAYDPVAPLGDYSVLVITKRIDS